MRGAVSGEGLRSEALRAALGAALGGRPAALEDLFCRHGRGPDPRPNLRLGAAFGAEMQAAGAGAPALLAMLSGDDAAPDTPRVFLPMAAAYGWVGRLRAGRDAAAAWAALAELAGDERAAVRRAAIDALGDLAARAGGVGALLAQATHWLEGDNREIAFGATASVIDVLAHKSVLAGAGNGVALTNYLSRAIAAAADAPRSAERSDGRRRLLAALPRTLAAALAAFTGGDRVVTWLEAECRGAARPDIRAALSEAVVGQATRNEGLAETVAERLRAALEGSAKPPRDPTLIRRGHGRGKESRRVR